MPTRDATRRARKPPGPAHPDDAPIPGPAPFPKVISPRPLPMAAKVVSRPPARGNNDVTRFARPVPYRSSRMPVRATTSWYFRTSA